MDTEAHSNTSFTEELEIKDSKTTKHLGLGRKDSGQTRVIKKKHKKGDKKGYSHKPHGKLSDAKNEETIDETPSMINVSKKKSGSELRRYLEQIGIISALTSTIIELHKSTIKPDNPLEIFLKYFASNILSIKPTRLMHKIEISKHEVARLEKENAELRAKLEPHGPINNDILLEDPQCACVCPKDDPSLNVHHLPTFRHRIKRDTKKPRILRLGCDFEGIKDSRKVASPIAESDK